jgi:putative FmdB family regulatory protein
MPIFEYLCESCQHHWELIVSRSASDAPPCPQCGKPGHKELSAPAFQFKGGGWYATGYSKTEGKESGKAEAGKTESGKSEAKSEPAKSESKSSESKSSETKPAASTAATPAATPATPAAKT